MAIELGGLTPSLGLAAESSKATRLPIMAMVRPRSGGFYYEESEFEGMVRDVQMFSDLGLAGVVFGILNSDSTVDVTRTQRLVHAAGQMETVFHRAFDATPDADAALDSLIECGVTRVLTSGQKPTALEGWAAIKRLRERSRGRIEILPGSGLTADNVAEFVTQTGVSQVHLTAFTSNVDASMEGVSLSFNGRPAWEAAYRTVDPEEVARIAAAL